MARPIEMARGDERQTVYSEPKAQRAEADGWHRVGTPPPLVSAPPVDTETAEIVDADEADESDADADA